MSGKGTGDVGCQIEDARGRSPGNSTKPCGLVYIRCTGLPIRIRNIGCLPSDLWSRGACPIAQRLQWLSATSEERRVDGYRMCGTGKAEGTAVNLVHQADRTKLRTNHEKGPMTLDDDRDKDIDTEDLTQGRDTCTAYARSAMCPAHFTNAHPPYYRYLPSTSGVQRLLGTNYAPLDIAMDLALLVLPPNRSGVVCHLLVSPPHHLAEEVGDEALNVLR